MNKQNIQRLAMAIALLLAVNMNADAQLGGLLNKAKEVAKGVVQGDVQGAVQQQIANTQANMVRQQDVDKKMKELRKERAANEKATQDKTGQTGNLPLADESKGDVDFFFADGKRMGIYHPKTKAFDIFKRDVSANRWVTYTFNIGDNGMVTYNGSEVGIINSDGTMKSGQTKGISLDSQSFVYWNGKQVGSVSDFREIYLFSNVMAYYYLPLDPKIATFMFYCQTLTDASIKELLDNQTAAVLRPGSLHAQHHDAALTSIKRRIPQAQDVVITSNDWRIIRDNLGNIISRACDGWYIIKNGTGRRAISYCWRQQYMGGGQYGNLEASAANGFDPIDLE